MDLGLVPGVREYHQARVGVDIYEARTDYPSGCIQHSFSRYIGDITPEDG